VRRPKSGKNRRARRRDSEYSEEDKEKERKEGRQPWSGSNSHAQFGRVGKLPEGYMSYVIAPKSPSRRSPVSIETLLLKNGERRKKRSDSEEKIKERATKKQIRVDKKTRKRENVKLEKYDWSPQQKEGNRMSPDVETRCQMIQVHVEKRNSLGEWNDAWLLIRA